MRVISISPLRIVLIYAFVATLWILFSDYVVEYFVDNVALLTVMQTYKGLFFIVITSLLLYGLIKAKILQIEMMQKKLKEREQRLEYVIQGANLGYWDWDYVTNKHVVNDTWLSFLGLTRSDIYENAIVDWSERIHPEDRMIARKAIENTIRHNKPYVIEFRMQHNDGHWVWIEGSGAVVERDEKTHTPLRLAGTHRDISDRKHAEEKMLFLALNDPLTKLPNRVYLRQELEKRLEEEKSLVFLFLDLDYFKTINDMYGHTIGDHVIQTVAQRFSDCLAKSDFIARVGGDEFVIIANEQLHVEMLCEKLVQSLEVPIEVGVEPFKLGVSMGIACYPQNGESFEELFKNADTAMYEAKSSGKNCYAFYQSSMTESILNLAHLDSELQRGIENDEFVVYFQPQVKLGTNEVIGVEVLVRWQNPQKGLVLPGEFIARSEENHSIIALGATIFRKGLQEIKRLQDQNIFKGIVAINISSIQIKDQNFIAKIEAIRQEVGISASMIELELTESCLMENSDQFNKTFEELTNLGYKISIDDFGTGYSSMSYLKQLPLNKLKIDRSFIKDLPNDKDDKAISKAIIALGKTLELEVLAEGVETEEQKAFLLENGCDSVQGYYFAKPMNAEAFEAYLRQN